MNQGMKPLVDKIKKADAIIVGVGSGLSSAAGYNHYHNNQWFNDHFSDFSKKYGFDSLFDGFYHVYSTPEEEWAFNAIYIKMMYDAAVGQPYLDLFEILKDKEYFILNTNADMQVSRVFDESRYFSFQGDFQYFQCSQPCHDQLYPNKELIDRMIENLNGTQIPSDLIPRCNECGGRMIPWVRDYEFLEGKVWKEAYERYQNFLNKYLLDKDKNVLFLELGVGDMTPSVIQLPFWEMTYKNKNATYARINLDTTSSPEHIKDQTISISADIKDALREVRTMLE